MKLLLISDIHANLSAFDALMSHAQATYGADVLIAHLGDALDYGMRPNEIMERLVELDERIVVNLAGNHERALMGTDRDRFSSCRGIVANRFTSSILEARWFEYIALKMKPVPLSVEMSGYQILFVHGSLADPFWGEMSDAEMASDVYRNFDFVICGHTHIPLLKVKLHDDDSPAVRSGKARTTFINPGSAGQPRNLNSAAQYGLLNLETGTIHFNAVPYDIQAEIALYNGEIDPFYGERLEYGR